VDVGGAEGSISGVWRVDARLPETAYGAVALSLDVGGTVAKPGAFMAWVRP
jgi:hypothetical protein